MKNSLRFTAALLFLVPASIAHAGLFGQTEGPKPTATEIFHLRSECATLGLKILNEEYGDLDTTIVPISINTIINGVHYLAGEKSHYNPDTNRCYIEVSSVPTVENFGNRKYACNWLLYDGQTQEILASATLGGGKYEPPNFIFPRSQQTIPSFDEATAYIDKMMADDRSQ